MEQAPVTLIFVNIATVCIVVVFGLVAYMSWYLRKNVDEEHQLKVRNSIWLETLFYFRDLTKRSGDAAHYLYPLALVMLILILFIFCLNIFRQLATLDSLVRYAVAAAVITVIAIVIQMFRRLSGKKYLG